MPSHISVIPGSSQAGKAAIFSLLASDSLVTVRGFYRDLAKVPVEYNDNPRFEAVQGDVSTGESINFNESDAVFYIPPIVYGGNTDNGEHGKQTAENILKALKKAPGVKRMVLHSVLGAERDPNKLGVLRINHYTDKILKGAVPELTVMKSGNYAQSWAPEVKSMQADPPAIEFPVSPANWPFTTISVHDIGDWVAHRLLTPGHLPPHEEYRLVGPRNITSLDLKAEIEKVLGRTGEMTIVPPEKLNEFWAKHVPERRVQEMTDFVTAQLEGGVLADQTEIDEWTWKGKRELIEDLKEIAAQSVI